MAIAKLFPSRTPIPTLDPSGTRLKFAGFVGCKTGGVDKISLFWPMRTANGKILLQGKGPDGKILYGYTYRDASGRLMGETLAGGGFTTGCGCTACHIVVTLSGFPDGFGWGGHPLDGGCSTTDFTGLNGTHTLTLASDGCLYYKDPEDYTWLTPYSGCTIAQAFPAAGTQMGPFIYVLATSSGVHIEISGKGPSTSTTCAGSRSTATFGCGGLADHIGHTWYVPFLNFTGSVRLDAVL